MRGGPVSRILFQMHASAHPSMTIPLTAGLPPQLQLPTRTCWGKSGPSRHRMTRGRERGSYLALLPVGLAMPALLPARRWALTTPFHPYCRALAHTKAVSFLWRFPSGCPARVLPGTVPFWSPDFPPHRPIQGRSAQMTLKMTPTRRPLGQISAPIAPDRRATPSHRRHSMAPAPAA